MATPTPPAGSNSKNKPRLGRGLSSLISMSDLPIEKDLAPGNATGVPTSVGTHTPAEMGLPVEAREVFVSDGRPIEIPLDQITPNPHQPRRTWNEASLNELAMSIRSSGIIQPVLVRKTQVGFELIAGERRWRASKLAGLERISAFVRDIDPRGQAELALIENIQREDLNPVDRAMGYQSILTQLGLTQAELAGRLGEDRSSIANHLRILDLTEAVRSMLRDGRFTLGHAKLLAGVADVLEQERLAKLVVEQGLSVRNLERLMNAPPAPPAPAKPSAHLQDLEKSLSRQLGMRIQLRSVGTKKRGRVVIHYANLDQFDDLLERLGLTAE